MKTYVKPSKNLNDFLDKTFELLKTLKSKDDYEQVCSRIESAHASCVLTPRITRRLKLFVSKLETKKEKDKFKEKLSIARKHVTLVKKEYKEIVQEILAT